MEWWGAWGWVSRGEGVECWCACRLQAVWLTANPPRPPAAPHRFRACCGCGWTRAPALHRPPPPARCRCPRSWLPRPAEARPLASCWAAGAGLWEGSSARASSAAAMQEEQGKIGKMSGSRFEESSAGRAPPCPLPPAGTSASCRCPQSWCWRTCWTPPTCTSATTASSGAASGARRAGGGAGGGAGRRAGAPPGASLLHLHEKRSPSCQPCCAVPCCRKQGGPGEPGARGAAHRARRLLAARAPWPAAARRPCWRGAARALAGGAVADRGHLARLGIRLCARRRVDARALCAAGPGLVSARPPARPPTCLSVPAGVCKQGCACSPARACAGAGAASRSAPLPPAPQAGVWRRPLPLLHALLRGPPGPGGLPLPGSLLDRCAAAEAARRADRR